MSLLFILIGTVCASEDVNATDTASLVGGGSEENVELSANSDVSQLEGVADSTNNLSTEVSDDKLESSGSDENSVLGNTLGDDVLSYSDDSFTALSNLISSTPTNGIVELEHDYKYYSGDPTDGVTINKNLIINGNGYTIDGANSARIFKVTSGVTFNNINFINGYIANDRGAAIYAMVNNNNLLVNINYCNFTNNGPQGAVYSSIKFNVRSSVFDNNKGEDGIVVMDGSNLGAVLSLTVSDTIFKNNNVNRGVIYSYRAGSNIEDSSFINNKANSGAVYYYYSDYGYSSSSSISRCAIYNNTGSGLISKNANLGSFTIQNNWWGSNSGNTLDSNYLMAKSESVNCTVIDGQDTAIFKTVFYKKSDSTQTPVSVSWTRPVTGTNIEGNTSKGYILKDLADSNVITYKVDNQQLTVRNPYSFTALAELINSASNSVDLTHDYQYYSGDSQIEIVKSLIINGNNHTLNSKYNNFRVFQFEGDNVVLNDISFANGIFNGFGAAFIYAAYGTLEVNNCNFTNLRCTYANYDDGGGAIQNRYGTSFTLNSCNFVNCSSVKNAGAISNIQGALTVNNCNFTDCQANSGGAIHMVSSTSLTIVDSSFNKCNALQKGGAVFYNNDGRYAAAISNSNFTNCAAKSEGGALYIYAANFDVSNSNFINNTNDPSNSRGGGAIFVDAYITIRGSTFINNYDSLKGGAIAAGAFTASISGSLFKNNRAGSVGAVISNYNSATITFRDCIILNNTSPSNGANKIFDYGSKAVDVNYNWFGNNVTNAKTKPITTNSYINLAQWLYLEHTSPTEFDLVQNNTLDILFNLNHYATTGGTGYYDAKNLPNVVLDVESTKGEILNVTAISGGAFSVKYNANEYTRDAKVLVEHEKYILSFNVYPVDSFYALQTIINKNTNGTLDLNRDYHYYADYDDSPILISKNLVLNGNGHIIDGSSKSGIFKITGESVTLNNIVLTNAKSDNGGAIQHTGGTLTVSYSTLSNNVATDSGGGAIQHTAGTLYIINSNFISNVATGSGGAIFATSNIQSLTSSNFTGNSGDNGGALYINGRILTFENVNFIENVASNNGGALYQESSDRIALTGVTFNGNRASNRGGAVSSKGEISIQKSVFANNQADGNGGAVLYNDGTQNHNIVNSIILNNKAPSASSANKLFMSASTGTFTLNNNWWGNNLTNKGTCVDVPATATLDDWFYLTSESDVTDYDVFSIGESTNVKFLFKSTGSAGASELPAINLTLNAYGGDISTESVLISGGSSEDIVFTFVESGDVARIASNYKDVKYSHIFNLTKYEVGVNVNSSVTPTMSSYGDTITIRGNISYVEGGIVPKGSVYLTFAGKTYQANVDATGKFTLSVSDAVPGRYYEITNIYFKPSVDEIYYTNATPITASINPVYIDKVNTQITDISLSNSSVTYGQSITVSGKVISNTGAYPVGNVSVYIDGVLTKLYAVDMVNESVQSSFMIKVDNIPSGQHYFTIVYSGDECFWESSKNTITFTVNPTTIIFLPTTHGVNGFYNASSPSAQVIVNVTGSFGGDAPTGTARVNVSGKSFTGKFVDGVAIVYITDLDVGTYTGASVEYVPDVNEKNYGYQLYGQSVGFEIYKGTPDVSITAPSIGYGADAKITVNLPDGAKGSVVLTIDDNSTEYQVTDGSITVTWNNPKAGSYTITATFTADTDSNWMSASKVNATLYVERPNAELNLTVEDIDYGENALITLEILHEGVLETKAMGTVTVYGLGGTNGMVVNITNGKGLLNVSGLSMGTYNIVAVYSGYNDLAGDIKVATFDVNGLITDMTVEVNASVVEVGESVSVTVVVNSTINDPIYLYVDGVRWDVSIAENGVARFTVKGLKTGTHNITGVLYSNDKFNGATNNTTLTVNKLIPSPVIDIVADLNKNIIFNIFVGENATGRITINGNETSRTASVFDGSIDELVMMNKEPGVYTFNVTYSGDDNYQGFTRLVSIDSTKRSDYDMNITSSVIVRNEDATIYVNLPAEFGDNGNVVLTINGVSETITPVNGQVSKTISTVGLNNITVSAVYSGFDNWDSKTVTRVFVIEPTSQYDISISVGDAFVGEDVVINVSAPVQFSGVNFTITVNGRSYNVTMVDGKGNYTVHDASMGYYSVSVVSVDNDYYLAKTVITGFDVVRKTPVISVAAVNVTYPSPVLVTVDLGAGDVSGLVSIILNDNVYNYYELSDGKAEFNITGLNVGIHNIAVKYMGDSKYENVTSTITIFNISKNSVYDMNVYYDSNVVVNGTTVDSNDANQRIISIELPKDATGNVTLYINNELINTVNTNKTLVFALDDLPTDIYAVSVKYAGDVNYDSSSVSFKLNVSSKKDSILEIICPDVVYVNGQFNVSVVSNLEGDARIVLYVDGVKVAEKSYCDNFTVNGLSSGDHTLTVTFDGNGEFFPGTNSTTITVHKLDSFVKVSAEGIDVGENLIVNVSTSGNGSATIIIYDSEDVKLGEFILSVNNGEGKIIVPYEFREIGEYKINITYNGDDVYTSSVNSTTFLVSLASDYPFKVITSDALVGEDVVVNVTLPANANKKVTLTLTNGTSLTKTLVNGFASFIIRGMGAGDYKINVTYEGDNNYNQTTKLGRFTVSKNDPGIVLGFNTTGDVGVEVINSIVKGDVTSLIVTLPSDANGYVNVTGNNINIRNKELVNGKVNVTLSDLDTGNYNILVSYGGDDKYNNASSSIALVVASSKTSIVISPIDTQIVGNDVDVNVKSDASGNVTLYVNGVVFGTAVIVDGWANFTISDIGADVNPVNIFAVYESNGQYVSAFNSTQFSVEKLNTTISAASTGVNVTVNVLGDAGGSVVVSFNGVNYTALINDGVAVVSLPKVPGAYNLPVYYTGDAKYNANSTKVDVSIPWGDDYVLNATVDDTGKVTVNIDSKATGNVTVSWDGNSPVNVTVAEADGIKTGVYQLPGDLGVGSHIVTVSYAGDNDLGAKSYSLIYNEPKKASLIKDVAVEPVINGTKSLINVTMNGTESGSVIIELDGVNYTVAIKDGSALFEVLLDSTAEGKVYYLGSDVFDAAVPVDFAAVVNSKADSVLVIVDPVLSIGESATVTATVNGVVNSDVVVMINGVETNIISNVEAFTYNVVAVFAGNSTHKANTTNKTYVVSKKASLIKEVSVDVVVNGTKSLINVVMNSTESGSVIVEINNVNYTVAINEGNALFEILLDSTTDGVVYYLGNDLFNAAVPVEFTAVVNPKADSVVVINDPVLSIGEAATVTVSVNGVISDDIVVVINGVETNVISSVEAITYNVVAVFAGNSTHKANSTNKTYVVSKKASLIKEVSVDVVVNGTKSLINVVMNSTESGSVIVEINNVNYTVAINEGNALFEILLDSTTEGKVYYLGSDVFDAAVPVEFTAIVNPKADSVVVITTDSLTIGESVVISATVNGASSDDIKYMVNGIETNTIGSVEAITYNVVAVFAGNSTHNANTTNKTYVVSKKASLIKEVSVDAVIKGTRSLINVTMNGTESGSVIIELDGGVNFTVAIKDGSALLEVLLDSTANGKVYYLGNDLFNAAVPVEFTAVVNPKSDSSVVITTDSLTIGESAVISATVNGEVSDDIKYMINGVETGTIDFVVAGSYNVVAVFEGNSTHKSANATKTFTVNKLDSPVSIDVEQFYKVSDEIIIGISAPVGAVVSVNGEVFDNAKTSYAAGTYTVVVSVGENATHKANTTTKTFTVDKLDSIVDIDAEEFYNVNEDIIIGISAPVGAVVSVNGEVFDKAKTRYAEGNYTVVVIVKENATHKANSTTKTFTVGSHIVIKEDSIVVITTDSLTIGESAVISATVNGEVSDDIKYMINGVETNTIGCVEAITYNVVAVFAGNSTHKSNSTAKTFVVSKKDPTISISVDNKDSLVAIAYSKLTITVADGDASGFVLIEGLDSVLYKELENGIYVLDPLVLSAGEYNISVTYLGDGKYNKVSDNIEFNVSKGSATPEITGIVTPISAGSDLSFVVSVVSDSANGATGSVNVYVDGVFNQTLSLDDEYNNASVTIKGLGNGTHTVGVKYNGNDNFNESDMVSVDVDVNKITPTISIVVVDDYLEAIAATDVIITVAGGDATGKIIIDGWDGEFALVDGVYVLEMYDLVAGTYTVNVTYMGDDKYSSANNSVSFTVVKSESSPVISDIKDSINLGDDLTFVVGMDSDFANGNVTVYVDGVFNQTVSLDDDYANASVVVKGLGKGTHIIGVKYNGNDNYDASLIVNSTVVVNGKAVDPETPFTNPDSSNPETFGIELPVDATGNFTVLVDGKKYGSVSLVGGKANITVSGLSNGSHSIGLIYSGDDNYSGMGKNQTLVVVNGDGTGPVSPGSPDTVFSLPNGTSNPPVFSINLPSDANGNFTVSIGGKDYNVSVVNGKANITVEGFSGGSYPVVVSYSGDSRYGGLFKTATIKLDSAPVPTPTPTPTPVGKKATVIAAKNKITFKKSKRSKTKTFKVTLKEKIGGKKLSGKIVLFKLTKVNKIKLTNKVKKAIKKANAKYKKAKKAYKKAKGKAAKAKAKKKLDKAKKALTKAKKPQTMLKQLKKGKFAVKTKNGVAKLTLSKKNFVMKKFRGKNIKLTAKFNGDGSYLKSSKTVKVVIK